MLAQEIYKPEGAVVCIDNMKQSVLPFLRKHCIYSKTLLFCLTVCFCLETTARASLPKPLRTEAAESTQVAGTFTVILYGASHKDDLETAAFLDREGDEYEFAPFVPAFDYRIRSGLAAEEALATARGFVNFHPAFWKSLLSNILDPQGNSIGFEVKPLYLPFAYGMSDVLDIHYWPKRDGKIKITIRLIPSVERLKFMPGGDGGAGGGD